MERERERVREREREREKERERKRLDRAIIAFNDNVSSQSSENMIITVSVLQWYTLFPHSIRLKNQCPMFHNNGMLYNVYIKSCYTLNFIH